MVGLLIVSHSRKAAEGIFELAVQMAGKDHRIVAVGGNRRNAQRGGRGCRGSKAAVQADVADNT